MWVIVVLAVAQDYNVLGNYYIENMFGGDFQFPFESGGQFRTTISQITIPDTAVVGMPGCCQVTANGDANVPLATCYAIAAHPCVRAAGFSHGEHLGQPTLSNRCFLTGRLKNDSGWYNRDNTFADTVPLLENAAETSLVVHRLTKNNHDMTAYSLTAHTAGTCSIAPTAGPSQEVSAAPTTAPSAAPSQEPSAVPTTAYRVYAQDVELHPQVHSVYNNPFKNVANLRSARDAQIEEIFHVPLHASHYNASVENCHALAATLGAGGFTVIEGDRCVLVGSHWAGLRQGDSLFEFMYETSVEGAVAYTRELHFDNLEDYVPDFVPHLSMEVTLTSVNDGVEEIALERAIKAHVLQVLRSGGVDINEDDVIVTKFVSRRRSIQFQVRINSDTTGNFNFNGALEDENGNDVATAEYTTPTLITGSPTTEQQTAGPTYAPSALPTAFPTGLDACIRAEGRVTSKHKFRFTVDGDEKEDSLDYSQFKMGFMYGANKVYIHDFNVGDNEGVRIEGNDVNVEILNSQGSFQIDTRTYYIPPITFRFQSPTQECVPDWRHGTHCPFNVMKAAQGGTVSLLLTLNRRSVCDEVPTVAESAAESESDNEAAAVGTIVGGTAGGIAFIAIVYVFVMK